MTMESRQPEATGSNNDLVRSAALSSADLWHEILERLNEVQEGQLRLARAIESLGMIVCDALSVNPQAALAGGDSPALGRTPPRVSLAAGPSSPPHVENAGRGPRDMAATQRTVDSLLGADVFAPSSPAPDVAAAGTPGPVASPRFYVAPVPAENATPERQPVASGAWPRGRRVARGLAREAPTMTTPTVVPNLTPAAVDALLAAEFGDSSAVPGPAPAPRAPRVVRAAEGGALLTTLLGDEFGAVASAPSAPTAPLRPSSASPPAAPPVARPGAPVPPSPGQPPSIPSAGRPPQGMPTPPPLPSAGRPAAAPPANPSWAPTVDPRQSAAPPTAAAPAPAPARAPAAPSPRSIPTGAPVGPRPVPGAAAPPSSTTVPSAPTPFSPGQPVQGAPGPAGPKPTGGPGPATTTGPGPVAPAERRGPLGAVPATPAPFAPGALSADAEVQISSTPAAVPGPPLPEVDTAEPPGKPGHSAASMATEILSAAPRTPVAEPTDNTPTMLAEDVTIMAKGRRRRFRLR